MRCLRFPLLALATVFIISGCGGKQDRPAQRAANESAFKSADLARPNSARSDDRFVSELPALDDWPKSGTVVGLSAPESSLDEDTPHKSPATGEDFAKAEPPRSPEPADEVRKPETKLEELKRVHREQQQIRAGTLTAGSLNDQKNLDDYRDYLSEAQQSPAGRNFPPFRLGERLVIEVKDSEGNGVSDAQVTVTQIGDAAGKNEGVLLDTWTRADGRTFFSTGWDAAAIDQAGEATFELTVRPPGGKPVIKTVSAAQSPWVVELDDMTAKLPGQLDLALVIDTTSSMVDELNYLKVELDNIVSRVHQMFPNVEQRYALICYRDEGDDYVVRNVIDFTSSLPDFRAKLAAQSAKGGGDTPEAMHLALENSLKLSWRRENTTRVMFLVADAPPHHPHIQRAMTAVSELRQKGVAVYPLAASGVMDECEFLMRATAFLTRGQYLFLTDHSGVGNPHAKPHAPKHEVEPLNQLMIRMIASELSGKEVLAAEIIATEESDGSDPPPIPQEQNQSLIEEHPEEYPVHQASYGHGYSPQSHARPSIWDSGWFRFAAAIVIIAGIFYVDHRMRT